MSLPRHWLLKALDLETDRSRSGTELACEAVRALREAIVEAWAPDADPDRARADLERYAARLKRAQPGAGALASMLDRCAAALPKGPEAALAESDAILRDAETGRRGLLAAAEGLFRPGSRVLTYGHDETVLELLLHYGDRLERITVCEVRPLNEGVRIAAALAARALPVRVITEAQLDLFAPECELAIAAAERVLPDGAVVGPTGTAVTARICAAHGVPFYVVAERSRWVSERDERARFTRQRRPPSEVHPQALPGVEFVNLAFDLTPPSLIRGVVTDDSILTAW